MENMEHLIELVDSYEHYPVPRKDLEAKIKNSIKELKLNFLNPLYHLELGCYLVLMFTKEYFNNKDVDEKILDDGIELLTNFKYLIHLQNPQILKINRMIGKDTSYLPHAFFVLSKAYLNKAVIEMRKKNTDVGNASLYLALAEDNRELVEYYYEFLPLKKQVELHYHNLEEFKEILDNKRQ